MTRQDDESSEQAKGAGFKFIDRRRFDETGEPRQTENSDAEVVASTPNIEPEKMVQPPVPAQTHVEKHEELEDPTSGPITFSLFLQSLAQQTLMTLGVIPWPETGETRASLDHARETIDILTILHEKTKGNLTASEQRFFDSVLYELRVTYLQLTGQGTGE